MTILLTLATLGFTFDRFLYNYFIQSRRNEFIRDGLQISQLLARTQYMLNPAQLLDILATIDRFSRGQIWIVDRTGWFRQHHGEGCLSPMRCSRFSQAERGYGKSSQDC